MQPRKLLIQHQKITKHPACRRYRARVAGLIASTSLVASCATMPSDEAQRAATAAQTFGSDYRIAVTSWMMEPEILVKGQVEPERWQRGIEHVVTLQKSGGSVWYVSDVQKVPFTRVRGPEGHYNTRSVRTPVERALAASLEDALDVQTAFIDRAQIADPASRFESPMHSAKTLAGERGYDAIALVYFEPRLQIQITEPAAAANDALFVSYDTSPNQAGDGDAPYAMAYETHIAIRALNPDTLMHSHIEVYTCDAGDERYTLPSGVVVTRQQRKTFAQCEGEIIDQAITDLEADIRAWR